MAYTFKYQTIGTSKLPRPFLPLTLRYANRSIKIKALVDSGADFCMFNGELLTMLAPNVNLDTLEKISLGGIGGTATGYVTHIEIGVDTTFFSVPAIFSFEFSPDEFGGLAGQLGFFDAFKIQFDRANREVHHA
jgi:hypothetical protein